MKKFNNIVMSSTEPDKNSIWLKDGKLNIYTSNGWEVVGGSGGGSIDLSNLTQEQKDIIHEVAHSDYDMSNDFNNDYAN